MDDQYDTIHDIHWLHKLYINRIVCNDVKGDKTTPHSRELFPQFGVTKKNLIGDNDAE